MRSFVMALSFAAMVGSASAATMTFDAIGTQNIDTVWDEDGITADAGGRQIGGYPNSGTAHFDDSGSPYARSITFTTYRPFHARSFDLLPSSWDLYYEQNGEVTPYYFDNVQITGYRDGQAVTQVTFNMLDIGSSTYKFGSAFRNLDSLNIGFTSLFDIPRDILLGSECAPCTHYSIDNVTIAPVPLPASFGLLGIAGVALGRLRLSRRTGSVQN